MRAVFALALAALGWSAGAVAQVGVGSSGLPSYSYPVTVPPGVAGMTPQLSLLYAGGGVNGPQGHGWSLQGTSVITRCPSTLDIDGTSSAVTYAPEDRLCLDGQRLVRTNTLGAPMSTTTDAEGIGGTGTREFRTEKDSFVRVRAYGYWGNSTAYGPKWFRVWTKAGHVFDYGDAPSNPGGAIVVEKVGAVSADRPVMAWAVVRQSDTLGNYIDFDYTRRSIRWGSGTAANSPTPAAEWYVSQIRYTGFSGTPARAPYNKILFDYEDRATQATDRPHDPAEAYQAGFKNVSMARLTRIRSFVGPALVRTVIPSYAVSPVTGRSRITEIKECFGESQTAGEPGTKCTQPTKFSYADTGTPEIARDPEFNLGNVYLLSRDGSLGTLTADFNGDGRVDLLRWHGSNEDDNRLYLSDGTGRFVQDTNLNLRAILNTDDGCYYSTVIDMNADGLPDILRFAGKTNLSGGACKISNNGISHVFVNDGKGTFTPRPLQIRDLNGVVKPAELKRQASKDVTEVYCYDPVRIGSGAGPMARNVGANGTCPNPNPRIGEGWTYGAAFYLLDVNLDGRPDLVTTELPALPPEDPYGGPVFKDSCPGTTICTRVYVDDGTGLLVERSSNANGHSLYSSPGTANDYQYVKHLGNVDGDAFVDLVSVGKANSAGHWRSHGDGNFSLVTGAGNCERPIEFNGDGRIDCLMPHKTDVAQNALYVSVGSANAKVADFNLTTAGYELEPADSLPVGQRYGHFVVDLNGDDRGDILRWHDVPANNKLLLSNGDGTFRDASTSIYTITFFSASDGKYATLQGDFLGNGTTQLLRLSTEAPQGGSDYAKTNNLYFRTKPMVADRLLSVTSPTGLVTDITYATVANAPSGRYISDRGTSFAARYPDVDIAVAMPIVLTTEADSGVGSTRTKTEYAYLGLKADAQGDGMLGFRETRVQSAAPNGAAMTSATQYLQRRPYAGVARRTESRLASLAGYDAANVLSRTVNIYCDRTSATAPTAATEAAPCATTAKVTRPYLYKSTETGFDIDAARTALPTVTTTNEFDDHGNVTNVTVETSGTFDGVTRTHKKITTNTFTSDTAEDRWVLGRLTEATVRATAPNLNLTPSVGTAPYGNWTDGGGVTQAGGVNAAPAAAAPSKQAPRKRRPPSPSAPTPAASSAVGAAQ